MGKTGLNRKKLHYFSFSSYKTTLAGKMATLYCNKLVSKAVHYAVQS